MEIQSQQKLEAAKRGEYSVDSSNWVSQGWNFFTKNAGSMLGYAFLVIGISIVLQLIPIIGPLAQGFVVAPALAFGFYLYAYQYDRQGRADFNTFFDGFQHLGKLVPIILLQAVVIFALLIPFGAMMYFSIDMMDGGPSPMMALAILPFIALVIYISISWIFAYPLAVFFNLGAWEAMEASRKIISQNFWAWFGFSIIMALVGMAGMLALVIGLLVAYPVILYAQYAAFRDTVQLLTTQDPEDEILDHLVDDF